MGWLSDATIDRIQDSLRDTNEYIWAYVYHMLGRKIGQLICFDSVHWG